MAHAQSVTIDRTYLKHLTLNIYPDVDLKALYTHAREALTQHTNTCVDLPLIQGDRYYGLYDLLAGNRTCCTLQFDPLIATNAPFRLAIKPCVGGTDAHRLIRHVLMEIFGLEYELHMNTAKIAGYELATDISGTTLDDLLLYDSTKRVSIRHYDEHGRISRIDLGATTSEQQIAITNKSVAEPAHVLIKQNATAVSNGVEIVVKVRAGNTPIHNVASMANPLASLSLIRLPRTFHGSGSAAWQGFLDSCRFRGMQAALPRLPKPELRTRFRNRVAERMVVNWWHPSVIWSGFPTMVNEIGFPKNSPTAEVDIPHNVTKQERHHIEEDDEE